MTSNCSDVKSWLEICLKREQIKDIKVINIRYSEAGDGYSGDVSFVHINGTSKDGLVKEYNLVLKCSKDSEILRETSPAQTFFLNEIYFYEILLPAFTKFQLNRGIDNPFNSVPRYYGSFVSSTREVLVLEDLSTRGYGLWDKKEPMTRTHIDLVVKEYAKFHAISVALQDQFLEEYQTLTKPLERFFDEVEKTGQNMVSTFTGAIEEIYDVLKDDLDENLLLKWKRFGRDMETMIPMMKNYKGLKVINHGDCWNNNFMFQNKENGINFPSNVVIIDWQIIKMGSPISDLAHFLFACISSDDLNDLEIILDDYYDTFSDYLTKLKSSPEVYSKKQFLEDWKQYSKFGILFVPLTIKICVRDTENVMDMVEAADQGDFSKTFRFEIKDKTRLRNRAINIVKYVAENNLI